MRKNALAAGARGAYSAPPDPLAALRALLLRGGERKEGRGRKCPSFLKS